MGSGGSSGKPTVVVKPSASADFTRDATGPEANLVTVKPVEPTEAKPVESSQEPEPLPTNVVQVTQVQVKPESSQAEPELERKGSATIVSNMLEQMDKPRQETKEKEKAPGGTHLAGAGFRPASSSGRNGNLRAGQAVRIVGLENARYLNGKQGVLRNWDEDLGRWVVRLANGEEKGIRTQNLSGLQDARASSTHFANDVSESANKELEGLLLQTNWSAIYQLFYQRFGIAVLDKIERGSVVKAAVEMSLSIVAKCFALLRSDPGGRLHCTPLHIAALQSSTEAAEVIVRDLPKLVEQTHKPSHSALCPLHIAILCGGQAIVELLLEGRADPNVRTLHDICPLHLAATTSKDLCQALLSYNAEPLRRDVMGSTAMHYAAAFKQQPVVDLLVSNCSNSVRLASEGDQKRVTPLHISCALYAGEEDLSTSMTLLSCGAKPRQVDVSGAAAWDVVPWSQHCLLTKFFETHATDMQSAAQQWMDNFHESNEQAEEAAFDNSRPPEGEDQAPQEQTEQRPAKASPSRTVQREQSSEQAKEEIERLKKEHAAELERLKQDLLQKEQSIAKQQQSFEALQKLHEDTRNQTKTQLEDMQKRNADERADWNVRLQSQVQNAREEAHADGLKQAREEAKQQLDEQQRAFEAKREELEDELAKAKRTPSKADMHLSVASPLNGGLLGGGMATLSPPQLGATAANLGSTFTDFGAKLEHLRPGPEGSEESKNQIAELAEEVKRLENLYMEEQALRNKEVQDLQDQFQRAQEAMQEEKAGFQSRRAEDDMEAEKLRGENVAKQAEIKTLTDQLRQSSEQSRQLQEEISRIKVEAQDKHQQLERERQDAESKGTAAQIAFETKLSDMEMALSNGRSELEAGRARVEAAEAEAKQMMPTINRLNDQIKALEIQFAEEQVLRKKFHNQIQDMKGAIRVFCRFRPMIDREFKAGDKVAAKKIDAFTAEVTDRRAGQHEPVKSFQFDSVFDADSSQEDVFADCRELVQSAVDGYNVTIFAYGQTGAGKTWTMYGSDSNPGLAPRSIQALFSVIEREQKRGNKSFKVKAYMIEVYKQDIIDLLSDKPPEKNDKKNHGLEVKKDIGRGMMYVEGVTERDIRTPQELKQVLVDGEKKRHVAATKMNSASSRSHLLLSIIVECNIKEPEQVVYGKITLCDLAGSERPKKSEVSGDGLKEAIEINKSLTALGDVIEALTKGSKSVPYRNHKLTMLMQDSLGGTAKTLMFVNCSPAGSNCEETTTSLKWASRARQITNDVKKNADSKEVARLKQVIAMMSQAQNATDGGNADEEATNLRSGLGMVS